MSEAKVQRVNRPSTCRMFESQFLERLSRVHPLTVFVVWIPVVGLVLYRSWVRNELTLGATALLFAVGLAMWSLTEYVLHRWIFHWIEDTPGGRRIHFLLHGVHHDFPNDQSRLVMPLPFSVPLGAIFSAACVGLLGARLGEPVFAGLVAGYLVYDGTHFAVHHFRQTTRLGKLIKRHHMLHHHMDHDGGFGVSSPFWDIVFRTMPVAKARSSPKHANANPSL